MNLLDWLLVLAVLVYAVSGYQQGFIVGASSTFGLLIGGLVGVQVAPLLFDGFDAGLTVSLAAVLLVVATAVLGQALGAYAGGRLRTLVTWHPARVVDALGGSVLSVVAMLLIAWVLGVALSGVDLRGRVIAELIDRWGDAAIAIDDDVAERFHITLPITIVRNSVRLSPPREPLDLEALGVPHDRVSIGYVGFVRREKGWPELVEAARVLVDEDAPAHFVIIGGGIRPPAYFRTLRGRVFKTVGLLSDDESAMRRLVAERGLEDRFTFLPFTSSPGDVYRALDIVTFPNPGVGLGRPVLEAASYGKPVVAAGSRTGAGILRPEETGLLIPEPTPRALADALRRLIDDEALRHRFGAAAAENARLRFDPADNAAKVEALYARLLGLDDASAGDDGEEAYASSPTAS